MKPYTFGLVVLSLSGCAGGGLTASQKQTAETVTSEVGAFAGSPLPCTTLAAAGVRVGTACGTATTVVSDVADLITKILAGLPTVAGMRMGEAAPMVAIQVRGVTVTLPQPMAAAVKAKIASGS